MKYTPTQIGSGAGFAASFWVVLEKEVFRLGAGYNEIHAALKDGSPLIEEIARLIVGGAKKIVETKREISKLIISYGQTLAQIIAKGKYDYTNPDINEKNFPHLGSGVVELEPEVVHFGRYISSEDALKELDTRGLRAGTMAELAAYGAKHPDEQRIVALGQVWRRWAARYVGVLDLGGSGRCLCLYFFGVDWRDVARFLAFPK